MALIKCPNCQKEISDKAAACPACGFVIPKPPSNFCEECGNQLALGVSVCPNCGCPVETETAPVQQVEVTINKKNKKGLITFLVVLIVIVAAGVLCVTKYQAYKYDNTYKDTIRLIATSAAETEEAGNLIHDVWYNTIIEENDSKTNKYTKNSRGKFNDDFNDSLKKLYKDSDFSEKISSIKEDQEEIISNMKELTNPPDNYKEAYSQLKTIYNDYMEFSNLVINPDGTIITYTEDFNDADEKLAKDLESARVYF